MNAPAPGLAPGLSVSDPFSGFATDPGGPFGANQSDYGITTDDRGNVTTPAPAPTAEPDAQSVIGGLAPAATAITGAVQDAIQGLGYTGVAHGAQPTADEIATQAQDQPSTSPVGLAASHALTNAMTVSQDPALAVALADRAASLAPAPGMTPTQGVLGVTPTGGLAPGFDAYSTTPGGLGGPTGFEAAGPDAFSDMDAQEAMETQAVQDARDQQAQDARTAALAAQTQQAATQQTGGPQYGSIESLAGAPTAQEAINASFDALPGATPGWDPSQQLSGVVQGDFSPAPDFDATFAANPSPSKGAPATPADMQSLADAHADVAAQTTAQQAAAQQAAQQAIADELAAAAQQNTVQDTLTESDRTAVPAAPAPGLAAPTQGHANPATMGSQATDEQGPGGMTSAEVSAEVDQAIADNQTATQAAIAQQAQALQGLEAPTPAPTATPAPGLSPTPAPANTDVFEGMDTPAPAPAPSPANTATFEGMDPSNVTAAPAPGPANMSTFEGMDPSTAVSQGHANEATMEAQAGLGTPEEGHANQDINESMDKTDEETPAPGLSPAEKSAQDRATVQSIVANATKGITSKEDAIAKGAIAKSAMEKAGIPAAQAKGALTDIANKSAAALGYSRGDYMGAVGYAIDKGVAEAMQSYSPAVQAAPAPAVAPSGHANEGDFEGMDPSTAPAAPAPGLAPAPANTGVFEGMDPSTAPAPGPANTAAFEGMDPSAFGGFPGPALSAQQTIDQDFNALSLSPDIPGTLGPVPGSPSHFSQSFDPFAAPTTTPQTTTPQTTTPQTTTPQTITPQTTTPQTTTPTPGLGPAQGPAPGVPAPASPAATQAVTTAMQAAQANPSLASSVAAAAPGLVQATADAFRVPIPVAAMMVLQGMQQNEQQQATSMAGPSGSSVGFSDIGTGGGGNPSGPLNVDSMVGNVLGAPVAGLGQTQQSQTPGFKQGGLVQLAAGGLAKPVLSPSSLSSMGTQAHFGARNVTQPKGSHLAAINMPARAPGAHLINSTVAGRTDRIPMRARTGSFVIPADVVSGLGEGNTMAGAKMWGDLLSHSVTGTAAGIKRGASPALKGGIGRMGAIRGPGSHQLPAPRPIVAPPQKVPYQNLPTSPKAYADGGRMGHNNGPPMDDGDADTTPIVTAGGEMIVDPEIVCAMGGGDPDKGTDILHKSIAGIRKQVQAFNKTLPDPTK